MIGDKMSEKEVNQIAIQIAMNELNQANARIIQILTELAIVKKQLRDYEEPENVPKKAEQTGTD